MRRARRLVKAGVGGWAMRAAADGWFGVRGERPASGWRGRSEGGWWNGTRQERLKSPAPLWPTAWR